MRQTPTQPCPDPSALCRMGRELCMDPGQRAPGARLGGKLQCNKTDCFTPPQPIPPPSPHSGYLWPFHSHEANLTPAQGKVRKSPEARGETKGFRDLRHSLILSRPWRRPLPWPAALRSHKGSRAEPPPEELQPLGV